MDISAGDLKLAMRNTAAGIAVISTINSGDMFGFTASSFASVSLTPPLVLFCLNYNSRSLPALRCSGKFGVSILSSEQEEVSRHFAIPGIDKFNNTSYILGEELSCPLITDAICSLECSIEHEYNGGDHAIIVGLVKAVTINNQLEPLVYYSGSYHNIIARK